MISITPIPALDDNYFWLITSQDNPKAYIVDPGDGQVVSRVLEQKKLALAAIFVTHRHPDHTGGIRFLQEHVAPNSIPVYGPDSPQIPQVTHIVQDQELIPLFDRYHLQVLETPGHTLDHIVYYSDNLQEQPVLFCGDTLFSGGCGRLFDGTAEQLFNSLQQLATLPNNTQVYCAHEYTLANLDFAQCVEPDNQDITQRILEAKNKRKLGHATVPFVLGAEKNINPFLRTQKDSVRGSVGQYWGQTYHNEQEVFTQLRRWKDNA